MSTPSLLQKGFARWARLRSVFRVLSARACGAKIGRNVLIGKGSDVRLGFESARQGTLRLGDNTTISQGVVLHPYGGSVEIGECVYIGPHTVIYGHGGVEIGRDCLIAMHCRILASEHALPPPGVPIRSQPNIPKPTRLGHDVWLGAGVTVLGGVTIGDGCVVGAGAVVTKDLPANSIALGIPARVVGQRSRA